jgi:hypothetical protein
MIVVAHGISTTSNASTVPSNSPTVKSASSSPLKTPTTPSRSFPGLPPAQTGAKPLLGVFSATFTGSATIDATIISYNNPLGIKIDNSAIVKGVLWADGAMSLDGKVYGIVYASKLVDGAQAITGGPLKPLAVISGNILPVQDAGQYYLPFFLGKLSIISWLEQ